MSIGGSVSLGGNLNLSGMQRILFTQSDPLAPADYCDGDGGNGNGNGNVGNGGGSCSIGNGGNDGDGGSGGGGNGSGDPSVLPILNGGNGNGGGQSGFYFGLSDVGDLPCTPVSGPTPLTCVRPQTRIALFPKGCKLAGEVAVGDVLLTRTLAGDLVGEAVTAVRRNVQPCLALTAEAGRQLHCSTSHVVMVADAQRAQGRRTAASALTLSDQLLREDGMPVRLVAIEREPAGEVIQISMSGPHHVYLSEGLWSHNAKLSGGWVWPTAGS